MRALAPRSTPPYGSADRRRPSVPDPERMPPEGEIVVDIVAWPSETSEDARDRASDIKAACAGCPILGQDFDKRTTVVRARVGRDALGKVLELTAVESVRLPIGPEIEPSEWLNFDFGDVAPGDSLDVVIGIIDDGVVNHPLLDGLIVDPDSRGHTAPGHTQLYVCRASARPGEARTGDPKNTLPPRCSQKILCKGVQSIWPCA